MVQGHKPIFAVIPAYNEELTVSMVVHLTARYVDHVIVVDDGSADRTAEVAGYAGAEVIRVDPNRGKANAMKIGIQRAKELGCGIVVFLDADGQHDPAEIPMVISPVLHDDADLVIGSRYLVDSDETPRYRRVGQKTLDYATNLGKNLKITDTQSGFRAMQCSKIDCRAFKSDGYNVETDMIHYFLERGLRILEVPVSVRYDVPHKHKKNPIRHGLSIISHIIGLISYRRPLLTFGVPGFFLVVIGFLFGGYVFQRLVYDGVFHYYLLMMVAFSIVVGILLMTTALILNSLIMIVKMEL
ncbi:glycosyltransferase family 2 protein [Methanospirillum sp.]